MVLNANNFINFVTIKAPPFQLFKTHLIISLGDSPCYHGIALAHSKKMMKLRLYFPSTLRKNILVLTKNKLLGVMIIMYRILAIMILLLPTRAIIIKIPIQNFHGLMELVKLKMKKDKVIPS